MDKKEFQEMQESTSGEFFGVGIEITMQNNQVLVVSPIEDTPGHRAGLRAGDIIVAVDGQTIAQIGMDAATALIRGEENTEVMLTILRDGETMQIPVIRKTLPRIVTSGQLLEDNIGLVTIENFDARCAQETIAMIEQLKDQGAKALIFDVRYNSGGYKKELIKILDYLLPKGVLLRSEDYRGIQEVVYSDEKCLEMPIAVLVNGESYSAAEFFAAALEEYNWAFTAGTNTTGKSRSQNTFRLSDGSAVGFSTGQYFTPKGVSLAEVGGLKVNIPVEITEEMDAKIYFDLVPPEEDPQIQAAVQKLLEKMD
jgi:carboxyl-terminal processing protease